VLRLVCWGALIVRPGRRVRQLVSNVVYECSGGCSRGPRRCRAAEGGGGRRVSWRVENASAVEDAGAEGEYGNKSGRSDLLTVMGGSYGSVFQSRTADSIRVLGGNVEGSSVGTM
jgi:hypothetical protein